MCLLVIEQVRWEKKFSRDRRGGPEEEEDREVG